MRRDGQSYSLCERLVADFDFHSPMNLFGLAQSLYPYEVGVLVCVVESR